MCAYRMRERFYKFYFIDLEPFTKLIVNTSIKTRISAHKNAQLKHYLMNFSRTVHPVVWLIHIIKMCRKFVEQLICSYFSLEF